MKFSNKRNKLNLFSQHQDLLEENNNINKSLIIYIFIIIIFLNLILYYMNFIKIYEKII